MVGRRNHNCVDIIPLDNFPEVIVGRTVLIAVFFVHHIAGYVAIIGIDIANGYCLSICVGKKVRKINRSTVTAHTDKAYCNPFTCRDSPCLTQ